MKAKTNKIKKPKANLNENIYSKNLNKRPIKTALKNNILLQFLKKKLLLTNKIN